MDESESSSDEHLLQELKKAGLLKMTHKRKKNTKKLKKFPAKKKNSVDMKDSVGPSTSTDIISSVCAKTSQAAAKVNVGNEIQSEDNVIEDLELVNLENMPVMEIVGDQYMMLSTPAMSTVPFSSSSMQRKCPTPGSIILPKPALTLTKELALPDKHENMSSTVLPLHLAPNPAIFTVSACTTKEPVDNDPNNNNSMSLLHPAPTLVFASVPSCATEKAIDNELHDHFVPLFQPAPTPVVSTVPTCTTKELALPDKHENMSSTVLPLHLAPNPAIFTVSACTTKEPVDNDPNNNNSMSLLHPAPTLVFASVPSCATEKAIDNELHDHFVPLFQPAPTPVVSTVPTCTTKELAHDESRNNTVSLLHPAQLPGDSSVPDCTTEKPVDNEPYDNSVLLLPVPSVESSATNNEERNQSLQPLPSLQLDHISPASNEIFIALPSSSNVIADVINLDSTRSDDIPYHGDITGNKKRKSTVLSDPKLWQRNESKEKREKGESYLGYRREKNLNGTNFKIKQDVFKPARAMKPPCISSFCIKSKLRACDNINQDARQKLFDIFWKTMSWEQRRSYICSHVIKMEKKVTKNPNSQRTESRAYYFTIDNKRLQVCKKMFLGTLGIKEWFVRYWLDKTDYAMPPNTKESCQKKGPEKGDAKRYTIEFLTKLTKMPSHYCRESTSKLYLEPIFATINELYDVYKDACELESQVSLSGKQFTIIFGQQNLALFQPKKDQCDLCCSFKVGNVTEQEYNEHRQRKSKARAEKATDKLFAQEEICHVFTQDVQSVKLLPCLNASAIYYKTKLCIHNFTIYNLGNQEVFCYWFDESNSTLEASVFASCLVDYISKVLDKKVLPVILYSDGCPAQNRNAILSNALLHLAIERKITITQKYLEKGHTQMECDSVHSAIECKTKNKEIFLPEQYMTLTKKARSRPMPYECQLLDFNFFTDFSKNLIYKSIRPGKKAGDPVVTNLRVLEHGPDGVIQYKTCYDQELKPLPIRPIPLHRIKPIHELPKLYTGRLPITNRKYQDLQDLKSVIPPSCHAFYDELPHKN